MSLATRAVNVRQIVEDFTAEAFELENDSWELIYRFS